MFIDESHVTIGQLGGMYRGDRSRKENLVDYGFRLPSALDNRPLKFEEFEKVMRQTVFVSATPAEYERQASGQVVEQVVRPTGLVDPRLEVRPASSQVDDLLSEISLRVKKNERVLVTTLTKRMAEELTDYLAEHGVKVRYLHSEVETVERVEIIRDLRLGEFDVLVGINLLREGLDLPEVSLVAILDADKEGFLRSERSLIQTMGRAARHINGTAILYADRVTDSIKGAIAETDRRRAKQVGYNQQHGITPTGVMKRIKDLIDGVYDADAAEDARDDALAPKAGLRYRLLQRKPGGELERARVHLMGRTFDQPVAVGPDYTFTLPRERKALDEDAVVQSERKAETMTWRADIRTPELPSNERRLGDLRLECEVGMEAGLVSQYSVLDRFFDLLENSREYCSRREVRYLFFAERPLF